MIFSRSRLVRHALLLFLLSCALQGQVSGAPQGNVPEQVQAQEVEEKDAPTALRIKLVAPDSVKAMLERYVRVLNHKDMALPETRADRRALVRRSYKETVELLATEGYFKPGIDLKRSEDGTWILTVEPGEQAKVVSVDLVFQGDISAGDAADPRTRRRDAMRQNWALAAGQAFRQSDWDDAKQTLIDSVVTYVYAGARITSSRAEVDKEAGTVSLQVTLDSGPPFYLGDIEVNGLEQLPEGFVERFSTLKKGEPYSEERLLAFQNTLQAAPQFASVVVSISRDPALAASVPVRVFVTEGKSRHLSFGTGFSTNAGARVEMNWRDVNLRNKGWELSTGLRIEQVRQSAYADVILPPVAGEKKYRDSFGALTETSDIENLKSSVYAIGATRTRQRGNIETGLTFRYQHENLQPKGSKETNRNALTANWSWTQRKVDSMLDPRQGYVLRTEFGGGAKGLLSDQNFIRSYARFVRYQPVRERDVLILRAEAGLTAARSRDGIPQDFLFRTGGAQTVRGYAYDSLGVKEGRATMGGRYLGVASVEYINWFKPKWGAATFIDTGDAADNRQDFKLKTGYGVGARWRSPAGPIALDLAYGHAEQRLRLHFSIAVAF